jgi:hypothetical protein
MAKINRKNKTYKLNNLPELIINSFVFNNKTGLTGSMFSRPVANTLRMYKHYAIGYGFDKNNVLWMIENNVNGVECITFEDFLNNQNYCEVEAYIKNPFTSQLIIQRAKSKSNAIYFPDDFNCEHFVNYCYTGVCHSNQVQVTKSVFDIAISFLELKVSFETKNEKLLNSINETRKILDIKRSPEFQKSLGEMIKKDNNSQ